VRMLRVGWVLGAVFGIGTLIAVFAWYSLQTLGEHFGAHGNGSIFAHESGPSECA